MNTSDAVMVVPRARAQEVRELVDKLKAAKRPEATDHKRVHRPWGYYKSIDVGERFQVKRIVVSRAACCRCRSTVTARSTGLSCAAPPK